MVVPSVGTPLLAVEIIHFVAIQEYSHRQNGGVTINLGHCDFNGLSTTQKIGSLRFDSESADSCLGPKSQKATKKNTHKGCFSFGCALGRNRTYIASSAS